ncbi:hypothetical protein JVU11DRAFT_11377 [Chiua virens]|nr:hypothetical protein JVU11DRAFT_11377 [Chiua virens]
MAPCKGPAQKVQGSQSMKLLPGWQQTLEDLEQMVTILSCNVTTCWNSMFDILDYAIGHHEAVDLMTQHRELGLHAFKQTDEAQEILEQL